MKRILFLLMALMFAITAQSQGEITIGSGTGTTFYVPMYCNYNYSYSQTIYNSSEIIGGTISQIAYYMTSTDARTEDIVIYAGNTTKASFSSSSDYEAIANLTQVFSGLITFNVGWNYITFATPFQYNGVDNLIIAVDKNTGTYSNRSWQSHTSSFVSCLYYYQDNTNIDPTAPDASNKGFGSSRPNTKFVITPNDPGFCFAPSNLAYSNVLTNQATITWDANVNVASYLVEYKTSSQDWADATLFPGISGSTHVITNLNANTQYNIRVTPECTSALSSIISLRTACETITQFPWIEGFEDAFNTVAVAPGNKPAPFCWYIIDSLNTSSYFWKTTTTANSGTNAVYMYGYSTASTSTTATYQNNDWLISPIISLTGGERLNFWAKKSSSSYYPDLLVYAMDVSQSDLNQTASNANFVLVGSIDTLLLTT
ncbi:MAG: fibronectin type III domain-containing protein, partial [Bacteroidales bacterium]|nr:fibronectin type III domain-containing protein [Bacteroidales bacterium]